MQGVNLAQLTEGMRRHWRSFAVVLLLTFSPPSFAADAISEKVEFNIPAQSLNAALIEFSRQADVQMMGDAKAFGDVQTAGLIGRYSGREALRILLRDTGLFAEPLRNAVVVRRLVDPQIGSSREKQIVFSFGDMLVTGTRIYDSELIGAPVIVFDRQDIERTNYATVQDVVRSLPQVFGGGPSDDTTSGEVNTARSSGLNARGLGAGSTLVLLNGRRIAAAGGDGSFIDVSSFPLAAVERIEFLTDGASAIYGSDAVGGVVNIIMRENYQGAETQASRTAVTSGPLRQTDVSQVWGLRWDGGHVTAAYEFLDWNALPAQDRAFTADSDLRALGGDNFNSRQSNPGTIGIGGITYAIPSNQNGLDLSPDSLLPGTVNGQNTNKGRSATSAQSRHGVYLAISQAIGEDVELSSDTLYARRMVDLKSSGLPLTLEVPATNPFRVLPAGADPNAKYFVYYNFVDDLGNRTVHADVDTLSTSVAAKMKLPRHWEVTASAYFGSEDVHQYGGNTVKTAAVRAALADPDPRTALNPFGDGSWTNAQTLESIRGTTFFASESKVEGLNAIGQGRLFDLPAGAVRLAAGADYRAQSFQSRGRGPNEASVVTSPSYRRSVNAAFAELLMPIVSSQNAVTGVKQVDVSLSGRLDEYSDFGSTFNPRLGLEWSPATNVFIRTSLGRSFKAPGLAQLDEHDNHSYIVSLPDARSPTGLSSALMRQGGNASLTPETAGTWSIGIKWVPESQFNPTLSLSHFRIRFKDRIQEAPSVDSFLQDPRFDGIVERSPTLSQREAVCSRSQFLGNFGLTEGTCLTAPIAAIIDTRFNNVRISQTSGLDLTGSIDFTGAWGLINLSANMTYLLDFSEAQSPTSATTSLVDTVHNPLRLRMRNGVSWSKTGFAAGAYISYAGSYVDNDSRPNRGVDSWTTLDLQLSYEVDAKNAGAFAGCTFVLGVQNLFDRNPPFVNNRAGIAYDAENADPLNRQLMIRIKKVW